MMAPDFYYLGTLTRLTGLKGELCAFFDADNPDKYAGLQAVFIDTGEGEYVPYGIDYVKHKGAGQFVVKLAGVALEEAETLCGRELYLPLADLPPLPDRQFYFHEVTGFRVVDENKGDLGVCKGILELTQNPLIQIVNDDGKEILIPARQQFITAVDRKHRLLRVAAPEGLVDLYLQ